MPQRLPYQRTFSTADAKSSTGRFVNNTQLIASLPAGAAVSVAPITWSRDHPRPGPGCGRLGARESILIFYGARFDYGGRAAPC